MCFCIFAKINKNVSKESFFGFEIFYIPFIWLDKYSSFWIYIHLILFPYFYQLWVIPIKHYHQNASALIIARMKKK